MAPVDVPGLFLKAIGHIRFLRITKPIYYICQNNLMHKNNQTSLRYNFTVNLLDGAFFGFALGIASFTTVIPLYISSLTSSAVLIGLIPAIHSVGWQLPQLLTAQNLSRSPLLKPITLLMTINERLPFLGLAIIAGFTPLLGKKFALILAFLMLIWQGLGGGFTANAWLNLIGKVFPSETLATFFGFQSAAANLLASLGAIIAGYLLENYPYPTNYAYCFSLACVFMIFSWLFLSKTREPTKIINQADADDTPFWVKVRNILNSDKPFRWFLVARMLSQFAMMGFAFYMVYAVRKQNLSAEDAGILTSVLLITQVIANPLLGKFADQWSRKLILEIGSFFACGSAVLAYFSSNVLMFYFVFILMGIANTAYWTIGLAMSIEYGSEEDRPAYIGLANTLIAPSTIIAPILGGWIADIVGYETTFIIASVVGLLTGFVYHGFVEDPRKIAKAL